MQKRWPVILFGSFLLVLLIQLSIPCLGQTHMSGRRLRGGNQDQIGTERTPPKRSAYRTALWPITFALKLPIQVLRYTSKGIIIVIDETQIIPRYKEIFFNEAETIGIYPMPSLSPSSGFGGGLVFFYDDFLSPGMDLEINGDLSATSQHEVGLSLEKSRWASDRLYTNLLVQYEYDPDRDFYGIGFDREEDERSNFSLRTVHTELDFGINLIPTIHVGGNLGYLWADSDSGKDKAYPSVEKAFDETDRPAFGETLSFLVPQFSLAHDNATPEGRPHSGGREEFAVAMYHELADKKFRLIHYELQVSRYLHLFLGRSLAARVRVEMNSSMGGGYEVPFFLRSQLGGGESLRGYSTGRFSDKDSALATLEYRFPVWRHPSPTETHQMDGRIFMDAGRVFGDIFNEFTFEDVQVCGGFGLRFSSEENFIFRLEIAKSSEQLSVMFKQKSVF